MEQRLKERLFGAIVIIALFVIFLPMVFKEPEGVVLSHNEMKEAPKLETEKTLSAPEDLTQWQSSLTISEPSTNPDATWWVQVATFANQSNAKMLQDSLVSKGYTATLEPVPNQQEHLTWVMVGPLPAKANAEQTRAALEKDFKVQGLVVSNLDEG